MMSRKDADAHLVRMIQHSELMINGIRESSFRIEKLIFDIQCTKEIVSHKLGRPKIRYFLMHWDSIQVN